MGIMDTLKGLLRGKTSQVENAIDAAADKVDSATGGKAGGVIDTAAEKAKDAAGDVIDGAKE